MTRAAAADLEAAVPAGEDPVRYADLLLRIRDAALRGARPPAAPRPVITRSWERTQGFGVDPDHGAALTPLLDDAALAARRDGPLASALPVLADVLLPAAEDAGHVMVVVDPAGVVLWRDGPGAVQRRAEDLGFTAGATWSEAAVGTNAIGTALADERPTQVYSAEHFVRSHHEWTCAAAPIRDPVTGRLLGVVDLSGAADTVHPSTLALVAAAARMAEQHLQLRHRERLDRLRTFAAPLLARTGGRALVTDDDGWVAATVGLDVPQRVTLPGGRHRERAVIGAVGSCRIEPVPGGWLLRVVDAADAAAPATRVLLDLRDPAAPVVDVASESGSWQHRVSRRQGELLALLAARPEGCSAADLSRGLFGEPGHEVAVRAELSRLRRLLGSLVEQRPYRFAGWIEVGTRV